MIEIDPRPFILFGMAYALVSGALCSYVATEKGRDPVAWGITGALTGLLGLIALAAVPALSWPDEAGDQK